MDTIAHTDLNDINELPHQDVGRLTAMSRPQLCCKCRDSALGPVSVPCETNLLAECL
jgi:hypothetical protein